MEYWAVLSIQAQVDSHQLTTNFVIRVVAIIIIIIIKVIIMFIIMVIIMFIIMVIIMVIIMTIKTIIIMFAIIMAINWYQRINYFKVMITIEVIILSIKVMAIMFIVDSIKQMNFIMGLLMCSIRVVIIIVVVVAKLAMQMKRWAIIIKSLINSNLIKFIQVIMAVVIMIMAVIVIIVILVVLAVRIIITILAIIVDLEMYYLVNSKFIIMLDLHYLMVIE